MNVFVDTIYPLVLVACLALLILGVITLIAPRAHKALKLAVTGFWVAIAVEVMAIVFVIVSGESPVFITAAYLLAAIALLPLLGIGRLGTPEAAKKDPGRPVLQPDQIARVDAGVAILVAIAQAVVAWRFLEIIEGAA